MAVTGLPFAFAAAVIGSRYVDRYIPRDDDLIATLNEREAEFWRLVETETPPPVDGSESTLEALKRLYADADIEAAVELGPDDAKTYDLWIEAKRAAKRTKEIEQELGNQLRAAIGTATAATIAGRPVITYKPHSQSRFDEEAFKQAHPDLWLEFKRTSEVRPLRAKERL
jgi:predicted phage-related endonuclease